MIVNTGQRTDIPAYFSTWFYNRIRAGEVYVRNPFYPTVVAKYKLTPDLVDCISFCSKNPAPMLARLDELSEFRQLWYVTITPYGKDIEPNVPDWRDAAESVKELSGRYGKQSVIWRYDPVLLCERKQEPETDLEKKHSGGTEKDGSLSIVHDSRRDHDGRRDYDISFHKEMFREMCRELSGYTDTCVISFLQLYEKTKKNFRQAHEVPLATKRELMAHFVKLGKEYGIRIRGCCVEQALSDLGADLSGCATREVYERVLGEALDIPGKEARARAECDCLLGHDIGAYNTCMHGCLYCYANYDMELVKQNRKLHDPESPLLIGHLTKDDQVYDAKQIRYSHGQMIWTDLPLEEG